jgi:hypothetical protein
MAKNLTIAIGLAGVWLAAPGPHSVAGGYPEADVGLSITAPASVRVNEDSVYELTATNAGPDVTGVETRLPRDGPRLQIVSSQPPPGGSCKRAFDFICQLGRLEPGTSASVVVVLRPPQARTFDLTGTASADEITIDSNQSNDAVSVSTPVVRPIEIGGVPGACASRPFRLKVATSVGNAGLTKLMVDDHVLTKSTQPKLKAKVDPDKLEGAKHKVEVRVRGDDGLPVARKTESFKTC